jgi:hypothetical protein
MNRLATCVILAAVMLAAGQAGTSRADSTGSSAQRGCDTIKLGEPRRFTCQSGSNFNQGGSCHDDTKNKYFGWHPAD